MIDNPFPLSPHGAIGPIGRKSNAPIDRPYMMFFALPSRCFSLANLIAQMWESCIENCWEGGALPNHTHALRHGLRPLSENRRSHKSCIWFWKLSGIGSGSIESGMIQTISQTMIRSNLAKPAQPTEPTKATKMKPPTQPTTRNQVNEPRHPHEPTNPSQPTPSPMIRHDSDAISTKPIKKTSFLFHGEPPLIYS